MKTWGISEEQEKLISVNFCKSNLEPKEKNRFDFIFWIRIRIIFLVSCRFTWLIN